jgi:hypothetical protein
VPREQHALELEVDARRLPPLRTSPVSPIAPVTTVRACHSSDIVLQTSVRETGQPPERLGAGAVGIFPAVIEFPLYSSVTSLHDLLHSTGFVVARNIAVFFAIVFWLGLALWVNRDARRRIGDPILVVFATLLGLAVPYIGPVVYLVFRPPETLDDLRSRRVELQALEQQLARSAQPACPVCRSSIEPDYIACPVCATMLRQQCVTCKAPLEPLWQLCPYCASAIEPSKVDLDAALTAETQMITLVDDIPLVPQPETRAADA